jgi:hypothetical protein
MVQASLIPEHAFAPEQADGTFNYTYDNEGNTLTKTRIATGAVTEFVWAHRNRLGRRKGDGGSFGQLPPSPFFIRPLFLFSGTGPVFSTTVVSTTAGTTLWTVADHLRSVRDLVDNNGITRQHVVYDSFGRRLSEVDRNTAHDAGFLGL